MIRIHLPLWDAVQYVFVLRFGCQQGRHMCAMLSYHLVNKKIALIAKCMSLQNSSYYSISIQPPEMQCNMFFLYHVYTTLGLFFITTRMYRLQSTVQNTSVSSHAFKSIHPPEMRSNVSFDYHVYYTKCSLFSKPFICKI